MKVRDTSLKKLSSPRSSAWGEENFSFILILDWVGVILLVEVQHIQRTLNASLKSASSVMLTQSPADSLWCSSDTAPSPSWGLPCISKTSIGGKQPLKLSPSCTHARASPRVPLVLALFENHSQWTWKDMYLVAFSQDFFHLGQQRILSNLQSVFATLGPAPPQTHCDSSRLSVFQWKWK